MSINQVFSEETRFKNFLKIFLISNIFFRNGPIFWGTELDLKIYKSYICAKFQDDWIIFAFVIVRQRKGKFFQK